ncbi:hypothetical protein B0O99DRAFT_632945 [Bisporella sp. PMI_857]|nr:hypothetical protein B0O99DRAFT_632945 [Bisporella sp. PMI_857]
MLFLFLSQGCLATASLLSGPMAEISSSNLNIAYSNSLQNNSTCSAIGGKNDYFIQNRLRSFGICHSRTQPLPSVIDVPSISPWKYPISCTTNATIRFCTYSSPKFANNRGLSVLTKPEIANKISKYKSVQRPSTRDPFRAFPPPFEIKELPGRGLGVIANRTIERGERLFAHAVMGIFHNDAFLAEHEPSYREHEDLFHDAIDQLPLDSNELFWDLTSHEETLGINRVIGRLNTNTFAANFGGEGHSVIVPETARMNHDCRPNTMYYMNHKSLVHYTHASRQIHAGEEITITYIDPLQTYKERQDAIERSWGFKCTCSHCSMPRAFRKESDARIKLILSLNKEFENIIKADFEIEDMLGKAELLVSLYEQERLTGSMEDPYRIATLAYAKAGHSSEAVKWTMKATEAYLISEGNRQRIVKDLELL